MNINAVIQTERPPISDLVNGLRDGVLFVDPTFQRKLVWTEKQKVRLIETILMGYPMPEVYLWQQSPDLDSGQHKKSIVDGQQRLTTMRQFVANEWSLKASYLDAENQNKQFADSKWKDLPQTFKEQFWSYVVNTRVIPNSINRDTIVDVFMRLNETDKSLNPQEIRHAEFNGELITAAEEVTKLPFWENHRVFNAGQIRRMADIEFASSLLIYLRRGSVEENAKLVNEMYDLYNDEYEEKAKDIARIKSFLKDLDKWIADAPDIAKMFSKPVHIFTLLSVQEMLKAERKGRLLSAEKLAEFVEAYENGVEPDELVTKYKSGAVQRTRSKYSRDLRAQALLEWVQTA